MRRKHKQHFSIFASLLMIVSLVMPGFVGAQGLETNQDKVLYESNSGLQQEKLSERLLDEFEQDDEQTFLVKFKEKADTNKVVEKALKDAEKAKLSAMKAEFLQRSAVVNELKSTALTSQQHVLDFLRKEQVKDVQPFYIVNAIKVTATKEIAEKLANFDEVEKILPNEKRNLFTPVDPSTIPGIEHAENIVNNEAALEWNVERVKAPEAWEMGIDGNGIVVASIDSGVQWDHPALIEKYRGYNTETGEVNHANSWFDATAGQVNPYDDNGHGTHVTGTMVGSDEENNIGVAPGAKWIAVKAFTNEGGADADLLSAAEWIMAPGGRVDLAPDIVNNSWGGGPGMDEWYRDVVIAWRDANIFPVFAAGNVTADNRGGPGSVATPANYPESFAVGALDIADDLASFSLLGPSPYDEVKPDISAPGQVIRSSVPVNGYTEVSGTSMAAPAVSGVAALVLSANGNLSVDELENLLMDSAKPLTDETYPESPNNGYGHGLVDAQNAILAIDDGVGILEGAVLESKTELPVQAEVSIVGRDRSVVTNPNDGFYSIRYAAGEHTVQVSAYGFYTEEAAVTLVDDETTIENFSLEEIPKATLSGTVVDSKTGQAIENAILMLREDANVVPVRTDARGTFTIEAYEGDYTLKVSGRGYKPQEISVTLNSDTPEQTISLEPFYTYPGGELAYDDGDSEGGAWFLEAGNGWGVRMSLDEGKDQAMVSAAKFMFSTRGGTDFQYAVMDASGPNGAPGEMIAGPFEGQADLTGEWQTFDLSEHGIMVDGDFYIMYLQTEDRANTPRLEQDKNGEWSSRNWEMYKGYWYQLEPSWLTGNKMIRADVEYEVEDPVITSPAQLKGYSESLITVEGIGSPTTDLELHVNGENVGSTTVTDDGRFAVDVNLEPGVNELVAYTVKDGEIIGSSDMVEVVYVSENPMIETLLPTQDQYVIQGDVVTVRAETNVLFGDANFEVKIPLNSTLQSATGLKMDEVEPGIYEAVWKVPGNLKVDNAVINVSVTDLVGNTVQQETAGKLFVLEEKVDRLAGENRYSTAIEISKQGWDAADTVVLARGLDFADALTGIPLATALDAPILLTPSNVLRDEVLKEIKRLGASEVVVLGGEGAISSTVVKELEAANLEVNRIAGKNRFETAALIAAELSPTGASEVVIANGMDFPDALSVATYAAQTGMPILLSKERYLPTETVEALVNLGTVDSIVVGGASVISNEILAELPNAIRVSGNDRYATNIALAEHFKLEAPHVYIATGRNYADALTGAVLTAKKDSGILLVRDGVPGVVKEFIETGNVKRLTIYGGESAVKPEVEAELKGIME